MQEPTTNSSAGNPSDPAQQPASSSPQNSSVELGLLVERQQPLTAENIPGDVGSLAVREGIARLYNDSLRLAGLPHPRVVTAQQSKFLRAFNDRESSADAGELGMRPKLISQMIACESIESIRNSFLRNTLIIALDSGSKQRDLTGCHEAVVLGLKHHPMGETIVHQVFANAVLPEERVGIVRLVGDADHGVQQQLFEQVFDTWVSESASFRAGMRLDDGVPVRALRLHDSIRLLQQMERLYTPETSEYEAMVDPYRIAVRTTMEALLMRDQGRSVVPVLQRCLGSELSPEDYRGIVGPMFQWVGGNKVPSDVVMSFLAIPAVQSWIGGEQAHSELLPKPTFVRQSLASEALERAVTVAATDGIESESYRSAVKLIRYLGRWGGHTSSTFLNSRDLDHLAGQVSADDGGGIALYREVLAAMSLQPSGCSVAMQSLFRHLGSEENLLPAIPSLLGIVRNAVFRYPEIVLSEASRFRHPEQAMGWVVAALRESGEGSDHRAGETLSYWQMLIRDDQAEFLFRGAPLSEEQRARGMASLQEALSTA